MTSVEYLLFFIQSYVALRATSKKHTLGKASWDRKPGFGSNISCDAAVVPSHRAAVARGDRTGQSSSLQNGRFRGGFESASSPPAATTAFSELSMFHHGPCCSRRRGPCRGPVATAVVSTLGSNTAAVVDRLIRPSANPTRATDLLALGLEKPCHLPQLRIHLINQYLDTNSYLATLDFSYLIYRLVTFLTKRHSSFSGYKSDSGRHTTKKASNPEKTPGIANPQTLKGRLITSRMNNKAGATRKRHGASRLTGNMILMRPRAADIIAADRSLPIALRGHTSTGRERRRQGVIVEIAEMVVGSLY
jgi:hypothetical protein